MKKLKKTVKIITLLVFMLILLANQKVFATNVANLFQKEEYTEEFKKWLELSDEEKKNTIMPRMYDVLSTNITSKSPLFLAKMLGASINSKYSLKDIIPSNLSIRNQQNTQSCWAFASLSSLETNLALSNYKKGINTAKIYDFSERHMEYATSKTFANNVENKIGYNREVGAGGSWYLAESYLTNGSGAINEAEMPFENNENTINISEIQNKTISSQIYDTVDFADYRVQTDEKKTEIMNQIKQHIQNYGAVYASIHGNSSSTSAFSCYNNATGAKFCNSTIMHSADHAVSIVGWDDNYSIDNFSESAKPTSNGAWIIRNSWGEREEYKLSDLKEEIFNTYKQQCISKGWNSASEIPNEFIEQAGFTIENEIAYIPIGDNGFMYVSYEDRNISKTLYGIMKATNSVDYDNIYQYDEYYPGNIIYANDSKVMLCNIFDKKTTGTEYLTQVSLYAPETYTCKVYVNPNGTSKSKNDLQLVTLKAGESETFNAGYHTLEFSKPIEINANSFAVVIEVQGTRSSRVNIQLESKIDGVEAFNSVKVESGKCFLALGNNLENCEWNDLGKLSEQNSSLNNADSTIKAFTTNNLLDNSLKNIEITTPPTKTSYFERENFDKTGMVVKANYNSKTNPSVILDDSSYNITNGTKLKAGQTSVTISYKDKSVNQTISVIKNDVTAIKIKTPPTKTEYKEGQNFDKTGMVVEATYKDGTTKTITDYTIEGGNNLKSNQTQVTISYGEKTVVQPITVTPNPLVEIKVTKEPNKTKYVVGQNFDKTGMIVTGTYQDGETQNILDYTIENGTNFSKEQTSVIIKYGEKTTTQAITVEEKTITEISVDQKPSKLSYIQNKENLDLTGANLKVTYNDGTTENVEMSSEEVTISGFDNTKLGKITLTVTYQEKSTQFEVEIVEEEKAENSNLSNSKCDVKKIQAYYFTNNSKNDYVLINIEIKEISRNLNNDTVEYYYYLSSNGNEENINNWTKISETQSFDDKLQFTVDSRNVSNYNEIADEDVLYIYIKEVATKGGNQSVAISNSMKLETNTNLETYVNNAKKENMQSGNQTTNNSQDNTQAPGKLPQAGVNTIILLVIFAIVFVISIYLYLKYKNLSKYIK